MGYPCVWVGGLKGIVLEKDLVNRFSRYYGEIIHVKIPHDSGTSKSCHYGFVVFKDEHTAEQAASQANKTKIFGGKIVARGPAEQRGLGKGYSGEYKGRIGHVPTMDNDSRHLTQCKHYVDGTCTSGSDCPYRHSADACNPCQPKTDSTGAGIQLAPPRKCALEGCSEPCYVDDKGDIHECCSYIHGMEHSRRTEEEMEQTQMIKGVSHCFLPGCNTVTWPFTNYCGRTHSQLGEKSGLQPPKLPEGQKEEWVSAKGHGNEEDPLTSLTDMKDFLKRSWTSKDFKVVNISENIHAKPGNVLYEKFIAARNHLPQQYRKTCLAYHGTPEKNIVSICENGYDSRKRNKQKWGPGEYFAVTPEITLRCCEGGKKILLNELLLGQEEIHHTRSKLGIIVMKNPEHDLPRFVITFK